MKKKKKEERKKKKERKKKEKEKEEEEEVLIWCPFVFMSPWRRCCHASRANCNWKKKQNKEGRKKSKLKVDLKKKTS